MEQASVDTAYGFHEMAELFAMMSDEEYSALKADIAAKGLLQPIVLYEGKILDGRNRYRACRELGIEPVFQELGDCCKPLDYIVSMNLQRRHLNESQRAMIAAKIANMRQGERTDLELPADRPKVAQAEAAILLNIGERSIRRAKVVKEKGIPDLQLLVEAGQVPLSIAEISARRDERQQVEFVRQVKEQGIEPRHALWRSKRVNRRQKDLPNVLYRIVYADPPWQYSDSRYIDKGQYGKAERHYRTMSVDEICALGEKLLANIEDDAVLYLWTTAPMLEKSFKVINSWGFRYKTHFVWDKVKHNYGHYNSVRHELLMIATRGSCLPDVIRLYDSVQTIEKSSEHSEKPEEFRNIIDTLYPYGKRIELFARKQVEGWDGWGDEV